jgi:tetratricopeptide (TPR) repeat protein
MLYRVARVRGLAWAALDRQKVKFERQLHQMKNMEKPKAATGGPPSKPTPFTRRILILQFADRFLLYSTSVDHIFISHSSKDVGTVEKLAAGLREMGFEVWLDKWEIGAGHDFVAEINKGLHKCSAGIIVFSKHTGDSAWVAAEVSYFIWASTEEGKRVIPVALDDDAWIPPLLRPRLRKGIEDVAAIADALRHPEKPSSVTPTRDASVERVVISLRQDAQGATNVDVRIRDRQYGSRTYAALPADLIAAREVFHRGFHSGVQRTAEEAARSSLESAMADLGRALGAFCLPEDAGEALANLVDGCKVGTTVEICVEAEGAELLALPFEALRLPDGRLLATIPSVVMLRRPAGVTAAEFAPLAGPLKILVAVGAPDEGQSAGAVLDLEHELQNILDAVAPAQRRDDVEVRILEVGNPAVIGAALESDSYHVLHLSCHGLPGQLQLEDEDGRAVTVTAEQLLEPVHRAGRPLPMILLSSCHGGTHAQSEQGNAASMAEALLRNGVPCVLAMQTSVSDFYATELSHAFYHHLATVPLASRALAQARKELEIARQKAVQSGGHLGQTQPEYAVAGLFVAGAERPLVDRGRPREPLRVRPVLQVAGPVPQLRIDDLIGRRKELREALRVLRDGGGQYAGVMLTGIGGVGKSSLAGRIMQRLSEDGWLVPAHAGRFDLAGIALSMGLALQTSGRERSAHERTGKYGEMLCRSDLEDRLRLQVIATVMAEEQVLLVLDDFEQNLTTGGGEYLDPDTAVYLRLLTKSAQRGRLLITCRYPVPEAEGILHRVSIGPLSAAEVRKLILRLPGLRGLDSKELGAVLRVIGGHPRMLEFVDALLRGGQGRLKQVTEKLRSLGSKPSQGRAPTTAPDLDEKIPQALLLGARDVLLSELLELARRDKLEEVLLQTAVSNLPVTTAGVTRMLADGDGGDEASTQRALSRLEDLSLIYRFPDSRIWVHRWTAEGLSGLVDAAQHHERSNRAGRYRWWRAQNESHVIEDAVEAVRNFLAGRDYDEAAEAAIACIGALRRFQRPARIVALASEVLESLPEAHEAYTDIADREAKAHLWIGFTDRALARYEQLLHMHERLTRAKPDDADHQSDLATSLERVGNMHRALGKWESARQAYLRSLAVRERLADADPNRAVYQHNLSVAHEHVGDLYSSEGQLEEARDSYLKALAAARHAMEAVPALEPALSDYERHCSVVHFKLGNSYQDFGQYQGARENFLAALAVREKLAQARSDRADSQRDFYASYNSVAAYTATSTNSRRRRNITQRIRA